MNYQEEGHDRQERQEIDKPVTFFRFEDLRIYHKSLDYISWVQEKTMLFPEDDKTKLALRFNEAARSISLYISEGSARNKAQFVHYLKTAKSSIRQCVVYTTLAYRQNLLSEEAEGESRGVLMEMTKMIGALISSLQRSNNYNNPNYNNNHYDNNNRYNNQHDSGYDSFNNAGNTGYMDRM
jgi:four helix bundle protein